ncbi:hypothetical protein [Photobacterium nomapromontoriensis]|uniref:hypothetical protein n=1 Tax=Photobacterium nomapromontoriensis TaxID=2910237 RepID=UPI003D100434
MSFITSQLSAAEFKIIDSEFLVPMNYYPASTIGLCSKSNNCTYLSLNSHAIKNVLRGREVRTGMGDNKNISAKILRNGVLYSISDTSSSVFRASLLSHNHEDSNLQFTYSLTLTTADMERSIFENSKIASLSGQDYDRFIETTSSNINIPNKFLLDQTKILDVAKCSNKEKFCFSELAYYSDYNLYLVTLSMMLTQDDLKNNPPEQVLEGILNVFLASINPTAAEFYGASSVLGDKSIVNKYSRESIILGVDADIEGSHYVGYARVTHGEYLSISTNVEKTNESVVQFITRLCNVVRSGNYPARMVDENCNFSAVK